MSEVPSPIEFDQLCLDLVDQLHELRVMYRLGHGVAYSRQVVETVPTRTSTVKRMDQEALEKEAQAVLADHGRLRGKLRQAASSVRDATRGRKRPDGSIRHVGFTMAIDDLRSALERDEKRHGAEFDPKRFPRTATREDLAGAITAQRVREVSEAEVMLDVTNEEARSINGLDDIWSDFRKSDGEVRGVGRAKKRRDQLDNPRTWTG